MSSNGLKITRKLSASMIMLCWLFMFLFPVLTFNACLKWLFDITYEANRRSVVSDLVNEMSLFKRDALTVTFLEKSLEKTFFQASERINDLSASQTIKFLEEKLNFKVACLIRHDKDTANVDMEISPHILKYLKVLPRRLTKRCLIALNRQFEHSFFSPKNKESLDLLIKNDGIQKLISDSEIFLRTQFSLIADMPLIPDKLTKSISGKLRGPVYFFYHPFVETLSGKKFIRGGALAVILGRDLNMRTVLASSTESNNSRLRRGFSTLPFAIIKRFANNDSIITQFSSDSSSYFLTSTMAPETVVDLIQRGTIYPFKIEEIRKKMPLLRVSIPHASLQHPMHPYRFWIILFLKVFAGFGGIFLLHLFFFGLEFKSGIRQKTLIGICLIMILPFTLLVVAIVTWSEFNRIEATNTVETQQKNQLESVQQRFNDYLISIQQDSLSIASSLKKLSESASNLIIEKKLGKILKQTNASAILFDRRNEGAIFLTKKDATGMDKNEEELLKITSRAVLNVFTDTGNIEIEYIDGQVDVFTTVNPAFINEMLNSWGRLFEYGRFKTGNRTSCVPLLMKDSPAAYALVTVRYKQEDLIEGFLKNARKKNFFPDEKIMKLSFFVVRDSGIGRSFVDGKTGKTVKKRGLVNILEMATNGNSFSFIDSNGRQSYVRHYVDYPLIAIASSELSSHEDQRILSFWILGAFSILLIYFAYMIFGEIYLRPVAEFIRVTEKVGLGDLTEKVQLPDGDEFGDLKLAFDAMIEGLNQKEKMSQFVSQDVIKAVEAGSEDKMEPGGEKVEATVVFVQLAGLAEMQKPEEIMSHLSVFIEVVDDCAQKWGGVMDKVIEDTLMLVFRSNQLSENHAISACGAILEILNKLRTVGQTINAGIASGIVVSGRIGSRLGKLDYTVIGDTVNLAARLKAEAKKAGETGIVIAPSCIRKLKGLARVTFLDRIPIKGKSREYPLYELISLRKV